MYDFKLKKNEEIIIISDDALLKRDNDIEEVTVVVTNVRMLILMLPKNIENFRVGRMINSPIMKEIIFETEISNIEKVIIGTDFDQYILKDTNYFYLHDDMIRKYFKDNIDCEFF